MPPSSAWRPDRPPTPAGRHRARRGCRRGRRCPARAPTPSSGAASPRRARAPRRSPTATVQWARPPRRWTKTLRRRARPAVSWARAPLRPAAARRSRSPRGARRRRGRWPRQRSTGPRARRRRTRRYLRRRGAERRGRRRPRLRGGARVGARSRSAHGIRRAADPVPAPGRATDAVRRWTVVGRAPADEEAAERTIPPFCQERGRASPGTRVARRAQPLDERRSPDDSCAR